jgi:hypothetical protein
LNQPKVFKSTRVFQQNWLAAAIRRGPDSQHCCASIKIRTLHCRKAAVSLQRLMLRVLRKAAFQEIMFSKTSSLGKV